MKREIIILPSLLLASGFECLTIQDIKFLNNYRKHLDKTKFDLDEIFMVTSSDYELGGLLNPFNLMDFPSSLFLEYKQLFDSYPYISRRDIQSEIYQKYLDKIIDNLKSEIFSAITELEEAKNDAILSSISQGSFSIQALEPLKLFKFYQKTVALHLCGMGKVILDTFNLLLEEYMALETVSTT